MEIRGSLDATRPAPPPPPPRRPPADLTPYRQPPFSHLRPGTGVVFHTLPTSFTVFVKRIVRRPTVKSRQMEFGFRWLIVTPRLFGRCARVVALLETFPMGLLRPRSVLL